MVPVDAPDWVRYEAARGVACTTCGREAVGVKAHAVGFDYCRDCYHTGIAAEDMREAQLYAFRVAMPDWEIGVQHTGGGCFWLSFTPPDARGYYYAATDGEASLPTSTDEDGHPIRDGWGWVGRLFYNPNDDAATDAHPDYEGTTIAEPTVPLAMETAVYTGPDGEQREYQTYSCTYWNEYPKHCMSDDEIAVAIMNDWNHQLRLRA
jgi:hypothetical protein